MLSPIFAGNHSTGRGWARPFLLSLLILLAILVPATAAPPALHASLPPPLASVSLLAEGWSFQRFFGPVETALSDRRRMIQMAVVGMCIGLYILMRK